MIAICVGHSRPKDSGATSTSGVSEWDFNTPIAHRLSQRLRRLNIDSFVVSEYQGQSYGAAMRWVAGHLRERAASAAIELHFNWGAEPDVEGFEYLHWQGSTRGKRLADCFTSTHAELVPGRVNRGSKARNAKHRGALFLRLTHCPSVILEPFFGTNAAEWELYSRNPELLVSVYCDAISKYASNK